MKAEVAAQIPLDLTPRPAYGREDFLVGKANASALGWIDQWPNWPAPLLVLQGDAASGKSHLAAVWSAQSQARKVDPKVLADKTAEEIAALGEHLIFDGLDLWFGDLDTETTLFHLYNIFKEERRSLLVTTRANPTTIDFALKDLASRFRAAPMVAIDPPDDVLLSAILVKLFHDRQLQVSQEVIQYILPRMERSFDAVRSIVRMADEMALAQKRGVSIPLMRDVLLRLREDAIFQFVGMQD